MIAIIDYDIGNLRSVQKALETVGADAVLTREEAAIADADGVVLPGVGAFQDCMNGLEKYKLTEAVKKAAEGPQPFLGICVGLQMLFEKSEEHGQAEGLGLLPGTVKRFGDEMPDAEWPGQALKVPLMGWNPVKIWDNESPIFQGFESPYFYFVHSYYAPADADAVAATADYGTSYCAAVSDNKRNLFGTQFHPEKSQSAGLKLLENFVKHVQAN